MPTKPVNLPVLVGPGPDVGSSSARKFCGRTLPQRIECGNKFCFDSIHTYTLGAAELTEFVAIGMHRDGNVLVRRQTKSETLLQPYLPRCRVHQVDAAYDFGDALQLIVDTIKIGGGGDININYYPYVDIPLPGDAPKLVE